MFESFGLCFSLNVKARNVGWAKSPAAADDIALTSRDFAHAVKRRRSTTRAKAYDSSRGVINYYRQMASRYSRHGEPDFDNLHRFYRLFRAPGVGHCGGGAGPSPVNPFAALVDWVEHNTPPQSLLASGGSAAPPSGRTRPLCPYPQTAIYSGSGSTDLASSFHCGGNLETRAVVCNDVLTRYKHEVHGRLDFAGRGLEPRDCHVADRGDDDDEEGHHGDERKGQN
jgi:hypothetical protein